jgi:hypothetical protein
MTLAVGKYKPAKGVNSNRTWAEDGDAIARHAAASPSITILTRHGRFEESMGLPLRE